MKQQTFAFLCIITSKYYKWLNQTNANANAKVVTFFLIHFKNWMLIFVTSLGCKSIDRSALNMKFIIALFNSRVHFIVGSRVITNETLYEWCNSGADPAILKRGVPTQRKVGVNYMLSFKCIDRPKKGGSKPRTPMDPPLQLLKE